jgi:hypothetical protein
LVRSNRDVGVDDVLRKDGDHTPRGRASRATPRWCSSRLACDQLLPMALDFPWAGVQSGKAVCGPNSSRLVASNRDFVLFPRANKLLFLATFGRPNAQSRAIDRNRDYIGVTRRSDHRAVVDNECPYSTQPRSFPCGRAMSTLKAIGFITLSLSIHVRFEGRSGPRATHDAASAYNPKRTSD